MLETNTQQMFSVISKNVNLKLETLHKNTKCILCGGKAIKGILSDKASTSLIKNPNYVNNSDSKYICEACYCFTLMETWNQYVKNSGMKLKSGAKISWRTYSHIFTGQNHFCPDRKQMKDFILGEKEIPFSVVFTTTGKKQLIHLARINYSLDYYYIQLDEKTVLINQILFNEIYACFNAILIFGFSKTEIISGKYRKKISLNIDVFIFLEKKMSLYREIYSDILKIIVLFSMEKT